MSTPARFLAHLLLIVLLAVSGAGTAFSNANGLSFQELLDLARAGLDAGTLSDQVSRRGLAFEPTAAQLAALRQAGLSGELLSLMVRNEGLSPAANASVETVRVFHQRQEDGRVLLVLTNLDDDGNPIRDPAEPLLGGSAERFSPVPAPPSVCPAVEAAPVAAPQESPLVVINLQPPAPQPAYFAAPIVALGGIVGPYRYPDQLGFLGYGPGISSPGWFSGLGLNAANNFGHRKEDKPNVKGLDAFFGPPSR